MKLLLSVVVALAAGTCVRAEKPIHHIELKSCTSFDVVGFAALDIYPVSEGMRKVVQAGSRKTIEAADYAVGVKLRTKNTQLALQDIAKQICEQTGRPLGKFINTALEQIAPVAMLMAADADSVWFYVLTPSRDQPDTFILTCAYLLDRKQTANQPTGPTPPSGAAHQ